MHYKALTSFLVAIPCVRAVVHSCYGGKPGEVGMKCLEEGSEWCDVACTNAIVCTNGTTRLKETCVPHSCTWVIDWRTDTTTAICPSETETVEFSTSGDAAVESQPNPGCLPTFRVGASCGSNPELEGAMRCDDTCSNVAGLPFCV
ncbi:hypothetical protein LA080_008911 [Diaporthe eres]|nr:hypothetical protein LA080_008911 [Diaporthe eres]